MANDLLSALRTYLSKVSSGEKTPQEMAAALNAWARESGESIKIRVEEEVARTVKKMGFAKQEEVDRLARELEAIKSKLVVQSTRSNPKQSGKSTNTANKTKSVQPKAKKAASKLTKNVSTKNVAKSATKSSNKSATKSAKKKAAK